MEFACPTCRDLGWMLDCNPTKAPLALELIECPVPDCQQSGRDLLYLSLQPRFSSVVRHPAGGWVTSLQDYDPAGVIQPRPRSVSDASPKS